MELSARKPIACLLAACTKRGKSPLVAELVVWCGGCWPGSDIATRV